jgi:hypothetical protein
MNDKIIIISPIYHDNITHVTDVNILDNSEPFADAIPIENIIDTNWNIILKIVFSKFVKCLFFSSLSVVCCVLFFILFGGIELFL